jgi:hypothetical protein
MDCSTEASEKIWLCFVKEVFTGLVSFFLVIVAPFCPYGLTVAVLAIYNMSQEWEIGK